MMTIASSVSEAPATAILASVLDNVQAVGATWIISSALFTTYSTTRYLRFSPQDSTIRRGKGSILPRATQLTFFRFLGSLSLGLLAHPNLDVIRRIQETAKFIPDFSIPAIFLFVANYSNSISLKRIGISLTYTSKCAIPIVTLIMTLILDGRSSLPSVPVLLSLVPIALGIAAASWDHPTFEPVGLFAAIVSCTAQSALNVSCKRVMNKLRVSGVLAQRAMITVGLAITCIFSIVQIYTRSTSKSLQETEESPPLWLTAAAATAYHVEYVLSFIFVNLVAPITYSTCDAIRRLGIIVAGHFMFGGQPFSALNIVGIGLALLGGASYSILNH